jgi:hypothetical protein
MKAKYLQLNGFLYQAKKVSCHVFVCYRYRFITHLTAILKIFREHSILFQAFTEFSIDKNILLDFFSLKLDTQISYFVNFGNCLHQI